MKIMTYNVHSCIDMQKRKSLPRIIELLKRVKPDFAGFNEIETYTLRTGFANQAKQLALAANMMFWYGPTIRLGPVGFFGNAALSRHPISKAANIPLPGMGEKRFCLKTTIKTPNGFLTLMVTHLGLTRGARELQIASLQELVRQEKNPVILMGDFNCREDQLAPLLTLLTDTGLGNLATYPFDSPSHRIDYILVSPGIKCSGSRVLFSDASDHLPVISEVEIQHP